MKVHRVVLGVLVLVLVVVWSIKDVGSKTVQAITRESFEIKEQIRYNSNNRIMPLTKENEETNKPESREAMARAAAPYNICMAIFLGVAVIGMIVLILAAPKNKK